MQNRAPKVKYAYVIPSRVFLKKEYFQYLLHPFYDGVFECYNGFVER